MKYRDKFTANGYKKDSVRKVSGSEFWYEALKCFEDYPHAFFALKLLIQTRWAGCCLNNKAPMGKAGNNGKNSAYYLFQSEVFDTLAKHKVHAVQIEKFFRFLQRKSFYLSNPQVKTYE